MSRVRIIGGVWRSRLVRVPVCPGLRPTPDRVRETLFNWLAQDLTGCVCLDLFAGSGVLGFEAASRGAKHVTLVEQDARACATIEATRRSLGASNVELIRGDALQFLAVAERKYDVVFLDPPFRQGWLERAIEPLRRTAWPDAILYAEAEREIEALGPWQAVRHARAGQVHYHLLQASDR